MVALFIRLPVCYGSGEELDKPLPSTSSTPFSVATEVKASTAAEDKSIEATVPASHDIHRPLAPWSHEIQYYWFDKK